MRKLKYTKDGAEDIPFREPGKLPEWQVFVREYLTEVGMWCLGGAWFILALILFAFQIAAATCWIWGPYLIYVYFFKG